MRFNGYVLYDAWITVFGIVRNKSENSLAPSTCYRNIVVHNNTFAV